MNERGYPRPTLEDYIEDGRIIDLCNDGKYLIWRCYGPRQKPPISIMFMATWVLARRSHVSGGVFSYELLKNRYGTEYPFDILTLAGQPLERTHEGHYLMSADDIEAVRLIVACL